MKDKRLLAILALTLSLLACSIFVGGPPYPSATVAASSEALQSLQDQIRQAVMRGAQSGTVTLQISESQITSFLASKLEARPHPLITEPQVFLRAGQMEIFGKLQQGILIANVHLTLQVSVDEAGQPQIQVVKTDLGPLPVPGGFNEALSALVDEAFTGSLGPVATGFRLESISIADGMMTVVGRIK